MFSGDTLFCGGPGATGRSYSDEPTILRSIRDTLLALPDETVVHTGHGESTTIGAERTGSSTAPTSSESDFCPSQPPHNARFRQTERSAGAAGDLWDDGDLVRDAGVGEERQLVGVGEQGLGLGGRQLGALGGVGEATVASAGQATTVGSTSIVSVVGSTGVAWIR